MADEFGFQTDEELGFVPDSIDVPVPVEPSTTQNILDTATDAAVGGIQGVTLGGADEIGGAIGGTYNYLTSPDAKSWLDEYRKKQQELQKTIDESAERSPIAYKVGEIGGSVLPALGTAGAGVAALGARAAGKTALAPYLAKSTAQGAGIGALSGVLGSKGTLEASPEQLVSDAGTGAVVGGVVGGVAGGLLHGASNLADSKLGKFVSGKLQDSPTFRQLKIAYRKGKRGEEIGRGDIATKATALNESQIIDDVANTFRTVDEGLSKQYGQVINAASEAGIAVPMQPVQVDALRSINDVFRNNSILKETAEAKMLDAFIMKMQTGTNLSPQEALSLKKLLTSVENKLNMPELQFVAKDAIDALDTQLKKSVPGFEEANKLIADYRGEIMEPLTGVKNWSQIDAKSQDSKLTGSVAKMLEQLTSPGHGAMGAATKRDVYTVFENLKKMEQANPGLFQNMGLPNLKSFEKQIINKADNFSMTKQALGQEPQSSPITNLISAMGLSDATTGRGMLMGIANRLGNIRKASDNLVTTSKNLYSMPGEALAELGNTLKSSDLPGLSNLGDYLLKGLNNKSEAVKNAALFSILQNPNARDFVYNLIPGTPEKE